MLATLGVKNREGDMRLHPASSYPQISPGGQLINGAVVKSHHLSCAGPVSPISQGHSSERLGKVTVSKAQRSAGLMTVWEKASADKGGGSTLMWWKGKNRQHS